MEYLSRIYGKSKNVLESRPIYSYRKFLIGTPWCKNKILFVPHGLYTKLGGTFFDFIGSIQNLNSPYSFDIEVFFYLFLKLKKMFWANNKLIHGLYIDNLFIYFSFLFIYFILNMTLI